MPETAAHALALALLLLLPRPAAPAHLCWALLISGSIDPADLRHAAGAAALASALARGQPASTTIRLFLAHSPAALADLPAAVTSLVGPHAASAHPPDAVGPDVTPALALAALTRAHMPWHPPGWRLPPPHRSASTGLLFLTGHGGPGFLRIGGGDLTSPALAAALARAPADRVLLVADTCRAASLAPPPPPRAAASLPAVTTLASAAANEASHSGGWWTGGGPGGWAGATSERFTAALVRALVEDIEGEAAAEEEEAGEETVAGLLARPAFSRSALLSSSAIIGVGGSWAVADFFGEQKGVLEMK